MKLVCFDLDGVLVDSMDWHYRSFANAMKEVSGHTLGHDYHEQNLKGLPTLKKVDTLVSMGMLTPDQGREVVRLKTVYFNERVRENLEPDLVKIAMVQQLKRDFLHVAVVSNCNRQNAERLLRGIGLLDEIEYLVSSSDVVAGKPSPEGYYKAMIYFGASQEDTLIVEDSPVGLEAAFESGATYLPVNRVEDVTYDLIAKYL